MSPHGDYDHMGEAINLIENYKVNKVIFNLIMQIYLVIIKLKKDNNYEKNKDDYDLEI